MPFLGPAMRAFLLLLVLAASLVRAAPLSPADLPPAAREWLPWAWQGHEGLRCPKPQGEGEAHCVWLGSLSLQAGPDGATFRQQVQVFGTPSSVPLPGDAMLWPQDVRVSGQPGAVGEHNGVPQLRLPPGRHAIEGRLPWRSVPQDLQLPPGLAAVEASLNGQRLTHAPDAQGRLWLRAAEGQGAPEGDSLAEQRVRLLQDGVPLQLVTRIQLQVAGKPRALVLERVMLEGWQLADLESPLPARLEADGSLRLQARPGSWTLLLTARRLAPLDRLALPEGAADETWLFQADPAQRVVSASGLTAIDPSQVEMPEPWRALPAFRAQAAQALVLTASRRGVPEPDADRLQLQRTLWLDFDGGGFTWRDQLSGSASRSTRLAMAEGVVLGRASVDGQDQPITQDAGRSGFALRSLQPRIEAEGRFEGGSRSLPVSGWQTGMERVQQQLHLPPGWTLLHASGVSAAPSSWVAQWTLWDLFFVLLGSLAAFKLLGWRVGVLLGLTLVLAWHTMPARALWFVLLALLGLQRVLPEGQAAARWLGLARQAVVALLAVLWLPHAVEQVRLAIYPQLGWGEATVVAGAAPAEAQQEVAMAQAEVEAAQDASAPRALARRAEASVSQAEYKLGKLLSPWAQDPRARVQTGPGLPQWGSMPHALLTSGPVQAEQSMRLWLLPPWVQSAWRLLALALLALALARLVGFTPAWRRGGPAQGFARPGLLVLIALLGSAPLWAQPASAPAAAPWPSDAQLQQLRERSHPAPACAPQCVQVPRAWLSAEGGRVQLRLEVHAQAEVSLPLPGQGSGWRPLAILRDGEPAAARRDAQGQLFGVAPAGVSQWLLSMDAPEGASTLSIALPLVPRALQTELRGWTLAGLDARGLPSGALTLTRELAPAARSASEPERTHARDQLLPLARVERHLQLGLQWRVETRVQRASSSRAPLTVRWALLPGEAVTEGSAQVVDGIVSVTLGADDALRIASSLPEQASLPLRALAQPQQLETWRLSASGQWAIDWPRDAQALAPVAHHGEGGAWSPLWTPWPGEALTLQVRRPKEAGGQTLTLDRVHTQMRPGADSTEGSLDLMLRTSLGGEHPITLPAGAQLLRVQRNGEALPLQLGPNGVLRLPLTPGAHRFRIDWRSPEGMGGWLRTPVVQLGLKGVNDHLTLQLPRQRIALLAGGPTLGPAFLFWGVLLVLLVVAAVLSRVTRAPGVPLSLAGWLLLCVGLAPASVASVVLLFGWFLLLLARKQLAPQLNRTAHNLLQLVLLLWTLLALGALLHTLQVGLLGYPDLMVEGNGSSSHQLNWFSDRLDGSPASAWVLSIPVWVYRGLMLLWALWLAQGLLRWLPWAWAAFSAEGAWRARPARASAAAAPTPEDTPPPA